MQKGEVRKRFFIAVFPPPEVADKIEKIMLKGPRGKDWSWNKKENLHISLGFPGALTPPELDKLKSAMAGIAHRAFRISLKGIDVFFDNKNKVQGRREHVVWLQPASPGAIDLKTLSREIAGAMKKNLKLKEGGPTYFTPHMTIAKTGDKDPGLVKSFAAACRALPSLGWDCLSFGIYESLNSRDPDHPANNRGRGSKYKKTAEFNLDG